MIAAAVTSMPFAEMVKRSAHHDGPEDWTPDKGFGVLDAARALEFATGRSS
jgi:hypothetical protein